MKYGSWLTLRSIILWFAFFDIGLGNGLRNKFTEAKAPGNLERTRIYISTAYGLLILIFSARRLDLECMRDQNPQCAITVK
jgi:hypothetical protein